MPGRAAACLPCLSMNCAMAPVVFWSGQERKAILRRCRRRSWRQNVNQQDQQAIDELFRHLYQMAAQAGPRDSDAEALIQRHMQQGAPGLLSQMAQTLVAQQHTLNQLRSQLAGYQ